MANPTTITADQITDGMTAVGGSTITNVARSDGRTSFDLIDTDGTLIGQVEGPTATMLFRIQSHPQV